LSGSGTDWAGRSVCVAGLGISGVAAAETLLRLGAGVWVVDARDGAEQRTTAAALTVLGAEVALGVDPAAGPPAGTELVVTSPGWRPQAPLLRAAAAAGIPVWGEVELAWRLRPPRAAPWLALTGTNGKTTTVRMLTAILQAAGHRAVAAGNVGTPLLAAVLADPAYDVVAVELSSFQLHWSTSVRPAAAAVLNLADDHLDWHGSFTAYAAAKTRIWAGADTVAIGNADDPPTAAALAAAPGRRVSCTLGPPGPGQLGVVGDRLIDRAFAADPAGAELAMVAEVRPAGPHNVANALAAAALARAYGVPAPAVAAGLRAFVPDAHRNSVVDVVGGVSYVDDSKATNPHAAAASLAAYPTVVWIAGGLGKGLSFDALVAGAASRLRGAVLLGACRSEIAEALARHAPTIPVVEVARTDTGAMPAAVTAAARLARPGDTVLLAPAAASMDMFRDYRARGAAFAAAVAHLDHPTP
jgi:UDP-N-acetylmuramoylalanine--D-glutamate ligase